jgi:hypothetical protein
VIKELKHDVSNLVTWADASGPWGQKFVTAVNEKYNYKL